MTTKTQKWSKNIFRLGEIYHRLTTSVIQRALKNHWKKDTPIGKHEKDRIWQLMEEI